MHPPPYVLPVLSLGRATTEGPRLGEKWWGQTRKAHCLLMAVFPTIYDILSRLQIDSRNLKDLRVCQSLSHVRVFVTPRTVACQKSSVHGISQARILEWVAISFSRESSQSRDRPWVSCIAGGFFTVWAKGPSKTYPKQLPGPRRKSGHRWSDRGLQRENN